jgi:sorting nexin-41/42
VSRPHDFTDVDYDDERPHKVEPKKGAYESRVEQILYENPDPIMITDAGKNSESGGGYIVYTIKTGVRQSTLRYDQANKRQDVQVRRRYSEFASLRQTLVSLHPTLIIPPIPEKHSMADYAAKPTRAKEDLGIIELRKRMLAVFLNRCRRMQEVLEDGVWWRFLDPNVSWVSLRYANNPQLTRCRAKS